MVMLRHDILARACLLAAGLALAAGPAAAGAGHGHNTDVAQAKAPEITIGAKPVAGKITMLMGVGGFSGGNVAVLPGPDGLLIVDDKLEAFSEKLAAALKPFGGGMPRFVLNTHWHFDHTGGNKRFAEAVIIAHDNVRKHMAVDQEFKALGKTIPASPPEALPDITYNDRMTVHFNGEEIQLLHLPGGHTDGDTVVYFKTSNVLHLGDLFFNGMFPFVDVAHGGNALALARNIRDITGRFPADAKIIPGHGPLATMADLEAYLDMLTSTTLFVQSAAMEGKDLKTIQAQGFPEQWKKWEWPFISQAMWIQLIHQSLNK
tara:strand:- start:11640 stop:12593 length:954 start_codon:yes stop_codon:yes gene_type:complete